MRRNPAQMEVKMNKDIFLRDLDRFLSDIPQEEREQALKYYEDYFEDAGPENEQQVIQELGSPIELAKQIKASNQENIEYGQGNDFHRASSYPDLYTQRQSQGYQNTGNQNYQSTGSQYNRNQNYQNTRSQYNGNQSYQNARSQYNGNQNYQNANAQYNNTGNGYFQGNTQYQQTEQKKSWSQDPGKIALVIVLAILAIPVGIPLISTVFALIVSIFAVCFALILTVFVLGGGLAISGIASTVAAFTLFPVHGAASSILVAGIGLVLLAVGIFIFWFAIWFCIKFFPAAANVLVKCCRSIGRGLKSFFQ